MFMSTSIQAWYRDEILSKLDKPKREPHHICLLFLLTRSQFKAK